MYLTVYEGVSMKIVLGTAQFGMPYGITNTNLSVPCDAEFRSILDCAIDKNISLIDTAQAYGNATSRLAYYHSTSYKKFDVINKILRAAPINAEQLDDIRDELRSELKKLQIKSFDTIMLHYGPSVNEYVTNDFLVKLKTDDYCKKVGISINNQDEFYALDNKIDFDVVQLPYSIINQNILNQKFTNYFEKNNVEIHVRSIFLQGLLLSEKIPSYLAPINSYIKSISTLSKKLNASIKTLCFLFSLTNNNIKKIIVGVQTRKELEENIACYYQALEILEEGIDIDWSKYNCIQEELINPSCWPEMKKQFKLRRGAI